MAQAKKRAGKTKLLHVQGIEGHFVSGEHPVFQHCKYPGRHRRVNELKAGETPGRGRVPQSS